MPLVREKDNWLMRRARLFVLSLFSLFLLGAALNPIEDPIWEQVKETQPELNLKDVEGALGQGLVIGLVGGFRSIIADFLFIRSNSYWEKKDRPNTEALLNLVTAIDPRPMFFWLNGARMMAYDMPAWEAKEMGGYANLPPAVEKDLKARYAQLGFDFMDKAGKFHPDDYRVPLEKAQIAINRLEDPELAAEYYEDVLAQEDAPYFAARIYAEMLKRSGKQMQAYNYLRKLYPTLPTDDVRAARPVVLERIREIEDETNMPLIQRFPVQPEEQRNYFNPTPEGTQFQDDTRSGLMQEINTVGPSTHSHDHAGHDHDH